MARNPWMSLISGIICAIAWWTVGLGWQDERIFQNKNPSNLVPNTETVNSTLVDQRMQDAQGIWAIPSIGFIGLILLNLTSNEKVSGSGFGMDGETLFWRIWAFIAFLCLLVPMVASIWVGLEGFIQNGERSNKCGAFLIVEAVVMLLAGLFFKFTRDEAEWGAF